jgi:hypothetical protein
MLLYIKAKLLKKKSEYFRKSDWKFLTSLLTAGCCLPVLGYSSPCKTALVVEITQIIERIKVCTWGIRDRNLVLILFALLRFLKVYTYSCHFHVVGNINTKLWNPALRLLMFRFIFCVTCTDIYEGNYIVASVHFSSGRDQQIAM